MRLALPDWHALVPPSIATRGAVLVLLVFASVALPGYFLHDLMLRQQRDRERETCSLLLSSVIAAEERARRGADVPEPAAEPATAAPDPVLWVGLVSRSGAVRELVRRTSLPFATVRDQVRFDDADAARPLVVDNTPSRRFVLLTLPRCESEVLAAIVDRGAAAVADARSVTAMASLASASLLGLLFAWIWLRRAIEQPIRDLGRRLNAVHQGLRDASADRRIPTELAHVVRSISDISAELERWRVEATYLRYSVESTVEARTRKAALAAQRAEREADTDALTRLGNRRLLTRELPRLFAEAVGGRQELAVLVMDVDHFKELNDACGHAAGDALLAFLGDLIRSMIRKGTDLGARIGGDEFIVALPGASAAEAESVGRRLAALFAQRCRTFGRLEPPPSLSVGVASVQRHGPRTWQDLVKLADAAMYGAKRRRGSVATALEWPSTSPP